MKLKQTQFYCVQCRKRVTVPAQDIYFEHDRAGKPRLVASDKYGHQLFKYVKWSQAAQLARKYD
jgi:hypothetical protein